MAKVIAKTGTDNTLILGVREGILYPFTAPNWTDLRLSAWVSLTKAATDDDNTGLAETLTFSTVRDSMYFGLKNNSSTFPRLAGTVFAGFANTNGVNQSLAASGTTDWNTNSNHNAYILDGTSTPGFSSNNSLLTLPGTAQNSTTYAQLWIAKFTRSTGSSLTITASMAVASLRTSGPDVSLARSDSIAATYAGSATGAMSAVPTCVFIYWPFNNSRLRIHSLVLEKYAP